MSLKHGLLGLLSYESMTGYELDKEFKGSLGYFWQAKGSQIYRELDAMEQNGWLVSERIIQDEKPNKRVYSITPEGKAEFMSWLASFEEDVKDSMSMKSAFLMRLFFAAELDRHHALKLLRSYREVCVARIKEIEKAVEIVTQLEAEFPEQAIYWKLTVMQGEMVCRARLEWVEKSIAILENEE